jgi:hypothetical protein
MKKIIFIFVILLSKNALSQQTIFNVPSADILEKDKNFLQHESQFRSRDPEKFWNATNYFARGIGYNTELDVTQFNLSTPSSKNVSLGIGTKTALFFDEKDPYKTKTIIGFMLPISLQSQGVGHWFYASESLVLPQTNTRITAGFSSTSKQISGKNANAFMAGIEQKITNDFSLIGDWYSGNHALGLAALGFGYSLPKDFTFYGGYQITNSKQNGRNSFVIEIAKIF